MNPCPKCQYPNPDGYSKCFKCGTAIAPPPQQTIPVASVAPPPPIMPIRPMSRPLDTDLIPELLGYLGCSIFLFGLFCPMLTIPLAGEVNFLVGGIGPGLFAMPLCAISAGFIVARKAAMTIVAGSALLGGSIIGFVWLLANKWKELSKTLDAKDSTEQIEGVMAIGLGWGWPLLFIGACLIVACGLRRYRGAARHVV